jgi:hypothetical protein
MRLPSLTSPHNLQPAMATAPAHTPQTVLPLPGPPTCRRSSCFMEEWMVVEGKLHSLSRRLSSRARATLFTKMTTCRGRRWAGRGRVCGGSQGGDQVGAASWG